MPTQPRLSLPVLAGAAIAIGLLVVGGILLLGQLGTPGAKPTPSSPVALTASPAATPSDPGSTPEAAVGAFFTRPSPTPAAPGIRRRSRPSPRGPKSSAYLTVAGFLEGQTAAEKASIVTVQEFGDLTTTIEGSTAIVVFDLTEGGYDIRLADASPLESPQVLPPSRVTVQLVQADGRWLVDAFEAAR